MRLDNRTKDILVTGEAIQDEASRDAIKQHFAGTGGTLEDVADGVKVSYKDRAAAEKVSDLHEKGLRVKLISGNGTRYDGHT